MKGEEKLLGEYTSHIEDFVVCHLLPLVSETCLLSFPLSVIFRTGSNSASHLRLGAALISKSASFNPGYAWGPWRGNSLQYSCLENPTGRGDWWTIVRRVTKSHVSLFAPNYTHACLRNTSLSTAHVSGFHHTLWGFIMITFILKEHPSLH